MLVGLQGRRFCRSATSCAIQNKTLQRKFNFNSNARIGYGHFGDFLFYGLATGLIVEDALECRVSVPARNVSRRENPSDNYFPCNPAATTPIAAKYTFSVGTLTAQADPDLDREIYFDVGSLCPPLLTRILPHKLPKR
jgi:hypothetical protein